jgi:hypothetical protein
LRSWVSLSLGLRHEFNQALGSGNMFAGDKVGLALDI